MKRFMRWLSVLLVFCMTVSLLPAISSPASAAGRVIQVGSEQDGVRNAVIGARDGDIIEITDSGFVNDSDNNDAPWVIDKKVTIRGASSHNVLNVRSGGIILGTDVTFENITLALPNPVRNVIMANGYTLTLNNVIRDTTAKEIDLACGGLVNSSVSSIPTAGAHGQILIQDCISFGNVYAGNVSDGTGDNTFSGAATVTVKSSSPNSSSIRTLYGRGREMGTVTGQVSFNLYHRTAAAVDGTTGGSKNAAVSYSGVQDLNDALILQNISSFTMNSGDLTLASGSDINGADLTILAGSTFRSTNLATPSVKNFNGGGLLVLGPDQTLETAGAVTGTTKVAIGNTNTADTAFTTSPQPDHAYIRAPQSAEQSFELLPYENSLGKSAKFVRGSDGAWTVLLESAGGVEAKIKSFRFTNSETMFPDMDSQNNYTEMGLFVEHGEGDKPVDINYIPYEITVNGVPAILDESENYTADGIKAMYVTADEYEATLSVLVDENDKRYNIEITVPGAYTETGAPIKTSAALVVGNPPVPPSHTHTWDTAWASDDTHHWHSCTTDGCLVTEHSDMDGYAAHTAGDWMIDKEPTATTEGSRYKVCTACGYELEREIIPATGTTPEPSHTHAWSNAWTTSATHHWHSCTADGCPVTEHSQMQGYAAHIAGEWLIDKEPTATTEGSRYKVCTACGYELERGTIPATGTTPDPSHTHAWSNAWTTSATHHWHSCTADGCPVTEHSQMQGYAAHIAGEWLIDKEPTATTEGSRYKVCTACGYELERGTIPATGTTPDPSHTHAWSNAWTTSATHHWHSCTADGCPVTEHSQMQGYAAHIAGEWLIDKEPTATTEGSRYKVCTACGYELERETIPATGITPDPSHTHAWSNAWTTSATHHWHSCTADGCPVTEHSDMDGYAAHTAGNWMIDKEPTATTEGSRYKICTACGYELERETIPATGTTPDPSHTHAWSNAWTTSATHHWHSCTADGCPVTEHSDMDGYAAHTAGNWMIDKEPTATTEGSRYKICTACGYELERETIPATGTTPDPSHTHAWSNAWTTSATHHWHSCTADGCPVTEHSDMDGHAAHTAGNWMIDKEPTATTEGSRYKICTACGYELERETIPATGITPDPSHTHVWSDTWTTSATHHWHSCTADGCPVTEHSQMQGYAAHTAGGWVIDKEPTATTEGSRYKVCTACGYELEREIIPATGTTPDPSHTHTWSSAWTTSATHHWHSCTVDGCPVTEHSQMQGYAAHTAGGWVIDRAPTAMQTGSRYKVCTVCGYELERETIPTTGGGASSGGGASGGSPSGSDSPSSSSNSTTTKNPDGSTTTTTTNRTTGTVTETTTQSDGSKLVLETQRDGTVTSTETAADGSITKTVTRPDGSGILSIRQADGTTVQASTAASGAVTAEVTLSSIVQTGGVSVALPIPELIPGRDTVTVHTGKPQPVKVTLPTASSAPGVVAVVIDADGKEQILKLSVPAEGGITAAVPNGATVKLVDNSKDFFDTTGHWAEDAVAFVSSRELFTGTGAVTFSPEETMTRAMSMTVLARLAGADISGGVNWYQKSMEWAVAQGLSDGSAPEAALTREQLITMLYRYAGSPAATSKELHFSDEGAVSDYALEAMCWGVENGILNGYGNGILAPGDHVTRAQAASMLMRLVDLLRK